MARKPARKSARSSSAAKPAAPAGAGSEREKIIAAFLALLAEKPIEQIGFAEIAKDAGVSLGQLRGEFSSTLAIFAAHIKAIDRAVLAEDLSDMAEEPPRERLFDVLMRRLEVLAPHREAVRSLLRSARRNPPLALALNRPRGALAAMDADRRRHQRLGPARHDARAGPGAAVRLGAAHLGPRRRSRAGAHHGGARSRAGPRSALCRLARRSVSHPVAALPAALAPAPARTTMPRRQLPPLA